MVSAIISQNGTIMHVTTLSLLFSSLNCFTTHTHTHTHRIFNAFNDSTELGVILTAGSGEITTCSRDEFESNELTFTGVSNRSDVTVGKYVDGIDSAQRFLHGVKSHTDTVGQVLLVNVNCEVVIVVTSLF